MRLYHGSLTEIRIPRILATDHIGDFGTGFYTTTDKRQATRFVATKCVRARHTVGMISCFEILDDFQWNSQYKILFFKKADEDWARFVEQNRRNVHFGHDYDIVYGPVADDQVYASFALYESGLLDFKELIHRLKVRKLTDQLLFHTERSLELLNYAGCEVVQCTQI